MTGTTNPFKEAEKIYKSRPLSKTIREDYEAYKKKYREAGPIIFAKEQLRIDPDTGDPLHLSDDQIIFLNDVSDLGTEFTQFAIIIAGRGCGKTFVIAVYVTWRIICFDYWNIASMGGSSDQSEKIQKFITGWRTNNPELNKYIMKDIEGEVRTAARSSCYFLSCSGLSTRGGHVREFIVDEEAEAERSGRGDVVEGALFQVSTSKKVRIIKSSTAHYVHGDFLRTWVNAEKMGYKRYHWSLAKHITGNTDPLAIYQDKDPMHWVSNVPWTPTDTIRTFRRQQNDDKWLVEVLGGISIGSGSLLKTEDVNLAVCDLCNEGCFPYKEGYCYLPQRVLFLSGHPAYNIQSPDDLKKLSTTEALRLFGERVEGIDWGRIAGTAWTITARHSKYVIVLFSQEQTGMTDKMKIDIADQLGKDWHILFIRPDPAQWSPNEELTNRGWAIHELDTGQETEKYIFTAKKYVERHLIFIPVAFADLIRDLRNACYDRKGKIRKTDSMGLHSFDSFIYAISYYDEVVGANEDDVSFWKRLGTVNPFQSAIVICPKCGTSFQAQVCPKCGWSGKLA